MDSQLLYFYKPATNFFKNKNEEEIQKEMVPFVEEPSLKQRFYIIAEGYSEIYVALIDGYKKDSYKIDIETPTAQVEFKIQNKYQSFNYCYSTNVYLATPNEYIYTKITTVNPYYIFVNQSNYHILIEQAEMQHSTSTLEYQLPMILGPNQRQAFFFYNLN